MYALADRLRVRLRAQAVTEFAAISEKGFDQLNVIRANELVTGMFRRMNRSTKACLLRVYKSEYAASISEMYDLGFFPTDETGEPNQGWLSDLLSGANRTTRYIYNNEVQRKRLRFEEEVLAAREYMDRTGLRESARRWLRLWSGQQNQYLIEAVLAARIKAMRDCGVRRVRWVTMTDEKVCEECAPRDGQVYDLDDLPERHYNCRCWLDPV